MKTVAEPCVPVRITPAKKTTSEGELSELQQAHPLRHAAMLTTGYFNNESVETYMRSQVYELRYPALPSKARVARIIIRILTLAMIAWVLYTDRNQLSPYNIFMDTLAPVVSAFLVGWVLFSNLPSKFQAQWIFVGYEAWKDRLAVPVPPEEVQLQCAELTKRLPGVSLEIAYLYEDPFVKASYKNPLTGIEEVEYVAFWDEKGFVH